MFYNHSCIYTIRCIKFNIPCNTRQIHQKILTFKYNTTMSKKKFYPVRLIISIVGFSLAVISLLALFGEDSSQDIIIWLLNKLLILLLMFVGVLLGYTHSDIISSEKNSFEDDTEY